MNPYATIIVAAMLSLIAALYVVPPKPETTVSADHWQIYKVVRKGAGL